MAKILPRVSRSIDQQRPKSGFSGDKTSGPSHMQRNATNRLTMKRWKTWRLEAASKSIKNGAYINHQNSHSVFGSILEGKLKHWQSFVKGLPKKKIPRRYLSCLESEWLSSTIK
jgi:hypothetical protein